MSNPQKHEKFESEIELSIPQNTTIDKNDDQLSPNNFPEPPTSPKLEIEAKSPVTPHNDRLERGIGIGTFSKFKNTRLGEEFSIYDMKMAEDTLSLGQNEASQSAVGQITFTVQSPRSPKVEETKKGFALSILFTIFTVEFAGALEIIYITPYFLKLGLNEWIDATFWMFPLVFSTLLKTPISIFASHMKYQRPTLFVLMTLSIIGCLIFACVDDITLEGVLSVEGRRILMTWFGLIAFCFIDVANEMASMVQNRIIEESDQLSDSLMQKASITGSIAKIFAYFCGSLQALEIFSFQLLERNMDSCFFFAGTLMFICIILCYKFQSAPTKGYNGPLLPKFKSLSISHFLPSFSKARDCSRKMKFILLSHFFAAGNIVMLSVYATSWVGQDVLQGDPEAEFHSKDSVLFEIGVSWGSLALMLTSFVILLMSCVLHQMVKTPQKKKFKNLHLFSQLLATIALYACLFFDSLNSVFLVIPLTGFAFQTFHSVPEILSEIIEAEEGINVPGTYRKLLDLSFFYAQVLMFLIVPLVFIFFPERDDNQWGMLVSATSGLLSVVFTIFI